MIDGLDYIEVRSNKNINRKKAEGCYQLKTLLDEDIDNIDWCIRFDDNKENRKKRFNRFIPEHYINFENRTEILNILEKVNENNNNYKDTSRKIKITYIAEEESPDINEFLDCSLCGSSEDLFCKKSILIEYNVDFSTSLYKTNQIIHLHEKCFKKLIEDLKKIEHISTEELLITVI